MLLAEDEAKLAGLVARGLSEHGNVVDVVGTGDEALEAARQAGYDVMLLDVGLPDIDGFRVCRRLREERLWTPVLMLTARTAVADRITGLDSGADDYLTKPFAFQELLARMRALARRGPVPRPVTLEAGGLRMDPAGRRVWRGDSEVALSAREFALLEALMRSQDQVLSRDQLLDRAWGHDRDVSSNVVDVCVRSLRAKIDLPFGVATVQTVRGLGYRLAGKAP